MIPFGMYSVQLNRDRRMSAVWWLLWTELSLFIVVEVNSEFRQRFFSFFKLFHFLCINDEIQMIGIVYIFRWLNWHGIRPESATLAFLLLFLPLLFWHKTVNSILGFGMSWGKTYTLPSHEIIRKVIKYNNK